MERLKPRVKIPDRVTPGEVMEVRTLISHPMETGYRRDVYGEKIPRHIINRLSCEYGGQIVFEAEFGPGIAANPYLSFFVRAESSGPMKLTWEDDRGNRRELIKQVNVA
ncbi:MAG: thiosulfate oxidation carrier complex protein SoxZ [Pseudomonadales bacterium]|nr:thiosulfate oxidation carrier complex protein SoxZ [Pseudomonadales bacterium]